MEAILLIFWLHNRKLFLCIFNLCGHVNLCGRVYLFVDNHDIAFVSGPTDTRVSNPRVCGHFRGSSLLFSHQYDVHENWRWYLNFRGHIWIFVDISDSRAIGERVLTPGNISNRARHAHTHWRVIYSSKGTIWDVHENSMKIHQFHLMWTWACSVKVFQLYFIKPTEFQRYPW